MVPCYKLAVFLASFVIALLQHTFSQWERLENDLLKLWCMKKLQYQYLYIWEAFLEYNISSYLNVWWKDVYSELRIGLSSHDISLLIIAFKFNWFLCFDRLPNQAGPAGPWPPWLFLKLYFVNYCSLEIRFCIILQARHSQNLVGGPVWNGSFCSI